MRTRRALAWLPLALLVGCQLFVKSDEEQCTGDANCTARGGDFASTVCVDKLCVPNGDRCVGKVTAPVEDRNAVLHSRLRFGDVGGSALKGVEVLVCPPLDEQCSGPVGAPVLTDADGYAYLQAWKNFAGTFQVKNPPTGFLKIKIHILGGLTTDDPPTKELPINQSVRLITRDLFALQLKGANATPDANAGHIFGMVSDCDLAPRPESHVAIHIAQAGSPILFYFNDLQLVAPQDTTETASGGLFGVANVPEGPIDIMTSTNAGKPLGRVTVFVNKDTISNFTVSPTPNP